MPTSLINVAKKQTNTSTAVHFEHQLQHSTSINVPGHVNINHNKITKQNVVEYLIWRNLYISHLETPRTKTPMCVSWPNYLPTYVPACLTAQSSSLTGENEIHCHLHLVFPSPLHLLTYRPFGLNSYSHSHSHSHSDSTNTNTSSLALQRSGNPSKCASGASQSQSTYPSHMIVTAIASHME